MHPDQIGDLDGDSALHPELEKSIVYLLPFNFRKKITRLKKAKSIVRFDPYLLNGIWIGEIFVIFSPKPPPLAILYVVSD